MGRMKPPEGSCPWSAADPLLKEYHDREWGVPQHDDRVLFEHLLMESMSCGLSWLLMLRKRRCFARNFSRFDYAQVAGYIPKSQPVNGLLLMEVRLPLPDSNPLASRLTDICLISPRALEDSGIKIATFFLILPYRLPLSISRALDRCAFGRYL